MKHQLQQIFELSRVDQRRGEIRLKLERIPVRLEELKAERTQVEQEGEAKRFRLAELEKQRRDLEGTVAMAEARLKEFQTKLNQIKTNKEYQAALKEVGETKKENKTMEDQILQIMTEIESIQKGQAEAEGRVQALRVEAEKEEAVLRADEEQLTRELQTLDAERAVKVRGLDSSVLAQYDKVRRVRTEAVAFVTGGTCQGCHMQIPPQLTIEIRKSQTLHTCPSCYRILYLEEVA